MNPLLLTDAYKIGHVFQYPKGTTLVYSNLTPRKSRMPGVDKVVFFGLQNFIKEYLIKQFSEHFFNRPEAEVVEEYKWEVERQLPPLPSYEHVRALHRYGRLPLRIDALPEGTRVPMGVPCLTMWNTHPDFFWLTNFVETIMSSYLWQPCTTATIAYEFKRVMLEWAVKTGVPVEFVDWQGHDFSFRGMSSPQSAVASGMAHLTSFRGTDTLAALMQIEKSYGYAVGLGYAGSVPATEHSVMCSGTQESEIETFSRLITDVYPDGIVSVVSDTWDLWNVLTNYMPALKDQIMARDGKVVIRPDSGDPVKIICGDPDAPVGSPARKGVVELLWDAFGGTLNGNGYRMLDSHVGTIYGDSITIDRVKQINQGLADKGFASQVVFGLGSFAYQYNTRDTFGFAIKATYIEVDGEGREIFKKPITDGGEKFSAKGLLRVAYRPDGDLGLDQQVSWEWQGGLMSTVFDDGLQSQPGYSTDFDAIRQRLSRATT